MPVQYNPFLEGPGSGSNYDNRTAGGRGIPQREDPPVNPGRRTTVTPDNPPGGPSPFNRPADDGPVAYQQSPENPYAGSQPNWSQKSVGPVQRPYATASPASYNHNIGAETQNSQRGPNSMAFTYGDQPQGGGDWLRGLVGNQFGRWNPFQPTLQDRQAFNFQLAPINMRGFVNQRHPFMPMEGPNTATPTPGFAREDPPFMPRPGMSTEPMRDPRYTGSMGGDPSMPRPNSRFPYGVEGPLTSPPGGAGIGIGRGGFGQPNDGPFNPPPSAGYGMGGYGQPNTGPYMGPAREEPPPPRPMGMGDVFDTPGTAPKNAFVERPMPKTNWEDMVRQRY